MKDKNGYFSILHRFSCCGLWGDFAGVTEKTREIKSDEERESLPDEKTMEMKLTRVKVGMKL